MENSNNTGKAIGALVVVALLGVVAGILYAPDKGSKTRAMLLGGAKDMASDLTDRMKEEASTLRDKANDLRDRASELKDKAGARMSDMANNMKGKVEDLKELS